MRYASKLWSQIQLAKSLVGDLSVTNNFRRIFLNYIWKCHDCEPVFKVSLHWGVFWSVCMIKFVLKPHMHAAFYHCMQNYVHVQLPCIWVCEILCEWLSIKCMTLMCASALSAMETVAAPAPCRVPPGWRISVRLTLSGHSMFTLHPWGGINLPVCQGLFFFCFF